MPSEQWRWVPGYESLYAVSDAGSLFDYKRMRYRAGNGRGCIVTLYKPDAPYFTARIGRLVLLAFVSPCPDGMECCHIDDDAYNNALGNLRWGTHSSNLLEAVRNGRIDNTHKRRRKRSTVWDAEGVVEARILFAFGWSYRQIAEHIGVKEGVVYRAVQGRTFKHLPGAVL